MKRVLSVFLSFVLIFSLASCVAEEAKTENDTTILLKIGSPTMTVNGTEMPIDEQGTVPVIVNDRTLRRCVRWWNKWAARSAGTAKPKK